MEISSYINKNTCIKKSFIIIFVIINPYTFVFGGWDGSENRIILKLYRMIIVSNI